MGMTFKELQDEVARRATRDQGGQGLVQRGLSYMQAGPWFGPASY